MTDAAKPDAAKPDAAKPDAAKPDAAKPDAAKPDAVARRAFSVAVYARRGTQVLVIEHLRLKTWLPIGGEIEAGETPLEAAKRELREETGIVGAFRPLVGALDGVPAGLIGYEEHQAGSKGLHMNFVFVAEVAAGTDVTPNEEFGAWRWLHRAELDRLPSPLNVRQFGYVALDAVFAT